MSFDPVELMLIIPIILMALTVHECSHAAAAYKLGDDTAYAMGRLTLNPIPHIDPIGAIMMFIAHFGWAKPVMVNPLNLKDPFRDMLWISLAGPASNILMATIFGFLIGLFHGVDETIMRFLILGFMLNFGLAIFNLFPIHPLDGSKVLMGLLPEHLAIKFENLEQYGMMILIGIILMERVLNISIFGTIIWKPAMLYLTLILGLFS